MAKRVRYKMYAGSDNILGEWFPISKKTFEVLLKEIEVLEWAHSVSEKTPDNIDHIWCTVDIWWKNRQLQDKTIEDIRKLRVKGMLYEYTTANGYKNIGIKVIELVPEFR